MMDTIDTRPLPGGPLSIDLLNTRWSPSGGTVDWLDTDDAVRSFVQSYDRVAPDADAGRRSLVLARDLVVRLFTAPGALGADTDLVTDLNEVLSHAAVRVVADGDSSRVEISSDQAEWALSVEAVVDAVKLLGDRPDRIRSCENDQCTLWFLDVSKAGRRRWCAMDRCGNRAKARRHYARANGQDLVTG